MNQTANGEMTADPVKANTGSGEVSDRRLHERTEYHGEIHGRIGDDAIALQVANLSNGGAFIEYRKKSVPIGTMLELTLHKQDDATATQARVVHTTGDGFAVTFVRPPVGFRTALSSMLTRKLMENATLGVGQYEINGRVAMLLQQGPDYEVLFTTKLAPGGVSVLTELLWAYSETLWITLLEHGMFDCECRVLWCAADTMELEFIDPSAEFSAAYRRMLDSFLG